VLTKVSEAVLPDFTQTFERLSATVQRLRQGERQSAVTRGCHPP